MQLKTEELNKLFGFLDSDTPAAFEWVKGYLKKQGVPFRDTKLLHLPLKEYTAEQFDYPGAPREATVLLAKKMGNAWRTRIHRSKKDSVSLSVILNKSVSDKLSSMSKGKSKAEVISMLIEGNFKEFLAEESRRKAQKAGEDRIRKTQRDHEALQKRLAQLSRKNVPVLNESNHADEFKETISRLCRISSELNKELEQLMNKI